MKGKRRWICLLAVVLLLLGTFSAHAETSLESITALSDPSVLWEQLPQETKDRLSALGVTAEEVERHLALQEESVFAWLLELVGKELTAPLALGGVLLGAVLLCALLDGMRHLSGNLALRSLYQSVTTVVLSGLLITSLTSCLLRAEEAVESSLVLLSGFVPTQLTLLAASGRIATAVSYHSSVLWISELLMLLLSKTVIPLLLVALALGTVGSVFSGWRLQAIGNGLCRTCGWGMGLIGSFFTGLLSLKTLAASATDTLSGRALRFSVASLIPMVGGALSDALLTLKGCLTAVRSTVGVFGIVVTVIILLPPVLACLGWNLTLSLCGYVAEVFSLEAVVSLTRSAAAVLKTVMAVLVMCATFLIVAMTVLLKAGGGG